MSSASASCDEVLHAVEATHRAMSAMARAVLHAEAPAVSIREFAVLRALDVDGLRRVSDLGEVLAMAPSSLTRYCDHLARLGLICRRRETRDRREIGVGLTAAGRQMVHRVVTEQHRSLTARLEGLSERERHEFVRLSDLITAGAQGDRRSPRQATA